ncbi:MAG: GGDEF domain-containing protein [Deltaproteobacteria bacterium]|nr:GGDEF domain-containing protein [Deltaproteobacteria bacterium]
MLAFGLAVGLVFPPFARLVLGTEEALSPLFFTLCVMAGLMVGGANYGLFSLVVSRNLRRVAAKMARVVEQVGETKASGAACTEDCLIQMTSNDAIGHMELAFNELTLAIAHRVGVDIAVTGLAETLSQSAELDHVAEGLLDASLSCCKAPAGVIYISDGFGFKLKAHRGVDSGEQLPMTLGAAQGLAERAIQNGKVELATDHGMTWFSLSTPFGTLRPKNVALVPLRAEGRTVGLIVLALDAEDLDSRSSEFLSAVSSMGGPSLQNSMLHAKLTELAAIDELTGLLNRRFGMRRLGEEYSRSIRHGVPLSVLMMDVDHFKRFNDTHGHDAGDEVLRVVGNLLDDAVRAGDIACRYGGEEFIIVAPGTGAADAGVMAERVRRKIETTTVKHAGQTMKVTMSIGIATWPMLACSAPEELVTAADAALYYAKEAGRNIVAIQKDPKPMLLRESSDNNRDTAVQPAVVNG